MDLAYKPNILAMFSECLRRVKGKFPMPTQEERIAALEQKTAIAIQEIEENTTIMLGVIRSQGQDIRKIFQRLEDIGKIFQRLETMDENINQLKTTLNEHTTLLTQILARLPKTP